MADKQTEYRIWHGRLSSMLEGEIEDIRCDAFNEFDAKVASGLIPVLAFKTIACMYKKIHPKIEVYESLILLNCIAVSGVIFIAHQANV